MRIATFLFSLFLVIASAHGQGILNISPVPVTNGVTGTLADASIVAALYGGASGTPEGSLVMLTSASALVGGFARFGNGVQLPGIAPGAVADLQVRAWSSGYLSYETAVASGLASVLAGRSAVLLATTGGSPSPPPVPNPLQFPGFTVFPVPEPSTALLGLAGMVLLGVRFGRNPKSRGRMIKAE